MADVTVAYSAGNLAVWRAATWGSMGCWLVDCSAARMAAWTAGDWAERLGRGPVEQMAE